MTRKYKTSYKTHRNSSRFHVTFDAATIASQIEEACTICGGKIEESPMMRGVCYGCYQSLVTSPETFAALKEQTELSAEQHKALQIVLDVANASTPDPRIARRDAILAVFRDELLSKDEAAELYTELVEIDQALQFHPSDTCQAYIGAAWDKMEPIQF